MATDSTVPNDWNPELYLRFTSERSRAAVDLIARIQAPAPRTVIDIGCGPGNSTQALAARFPNAHLTGLDNSPAMIAKARADYPQHEWLLADAASFESEESRGEPDGSAVRVPSREGMGPLPGFPSRKFDIVFSNAAIQWIPDHAHLVARLAALASPGGVLAVQTPMFSDMPIREAIARTAAKPRWHQAMHGCDAHFTFLPHGFYYDQLSPRASTIDMWETSYVHVMSSLPALIEWMRATGLRPYLERLAETADQHSFEEDLLEELGKDYHVRPDGKVLFPFKRLFFIAS
jgi:trans-aconitate 2-methyltransferase